MFRVALIIFALASTFTGVTAQIRAVRDAESINVLKMEKAAIDPSLKKESIAEVPADTSPVTNRAGTYRAFVLCRISAETDCPYRVHFTEIKTGTSFVITGEPTEVEIMRSIDELKWLDNDRLSYERWTNPHFGRRYLVNVRTKKQVGAWILSDVK